MNVSDPGAFVPRPGLPEPYPPRHEEESMPQPTVYRIEFGPAWPVPPITVDFADRNAAARQVAAHAIPHLKPRLTELGRPEFADCFFQTDRALTVGQFMWLSIAGEKAAQFCPARLTPTTEETR